MSGISVGARRVLEDRLRHVRARLVREDRPVVLGELRALEAAIVRGLAREDAR